MKRTIGRIAVVVLVYFVLLELILQIGVHHWRYESSEELSMIALLVLLVAGLIWACLPAFPERRMRILYRSLLVIALFIGTYGTSLFYGVIRVNIGLYEEPDWVAQYPGFQKEQRARIERLKW